MEEWGDLRGRREDWGGRIERENKNREGIHGEKRETWSQERKWKIQLRRKEAIAQKKKLAKRERDKEGGQ